MKRAIIILALLLTGCANHQIIAHRGDRDKGPENSMPSFEGCNAIELDVMLTNEGELAVIHDPHRVNVLPMSPEQLRKVRIRGEPIPLLEDVAEWAQGKGLKLYIDPKYPYAQGREGVFISEIKRTLEGLDYLIITDDPLITLVAQNAGMGVALSFCGSFKIWGKRYLWAEALKPDELFICERSADADTVEGLRAYGKPLGVVSNRERGEFDMVITDYP